MLNISARALCVALCAGGLAVCCWLGGSGASDVRAEKSPLVTSARPSHTANSGWVDMPAGARPAYMGINGGTVPVSLLTARDGQSMATFVGLTGNDFLRVLYKGNPDRATGASVDLRGQTLPPSTNGTVLMASTAIGNIPVYYCTGKTFSRLGDEEWLPFGLSEDPLSLEGQVDKPTVLGARTKKYRSFLLMQRLQRPTLSTR